MVHFNDIVAPQAVATDVSANGKKPLFQKIAQLAASAYGLNATMVSEALFERERLGSTGFGGGVAIPHAKIPGLDRMRGVVCPHAAVERLARVPRRFEVRPGLRRQPVPPAELKHAADLAAGHQFLHLHVLRVDAQDDAPVDIVFTLLSPVDSGAEHLKTLARVSRYLRDDGHVARLRGAKSAEALHALLAGGEARDAA